MINFYMTPGSCSTGIHILLEELELVFSANLINLMAGDQFKPEYIAINPKSSIPVLVLDDGSALTSFEGICWWLAMTHPEARLLPASISEQARALDLLGYIVNTIHGKGFTRIFTPNQYLDFFEDENHQMGKVNIEGNLPGIGIENWVQEKAQDHAEQLRRKGESIVSGGLDLVSAYITEEGRCLTPQLNVVDAALFYVEFWADRINLPMPERCQAHYQWMQQRSAVRQVLAEEGYRI